MGNKKSELLTQTELIFMKLIWSLGESTVREVRNQMSNADEVPYTTVAAVIRLLDKKGFLNSRLDGKTRFYSPAISKSEYEEKALTQIVDKLFNGATIDLATRLIETDKLTLEELEQIRDELARKISEAEGED